MDDDYDVLNYMVLLYARHARFDRAGQNHTRWSRTSHLVCTTPVRAVATRALPMSLSVCAQVRTQRDSIPGRSDRQGRATTSELQQPAYERITDGEFKYVKARRTTRERGRERESE